MVEVVTNSCTPNLRFQEYEEMWLQSKLEGLASFYKGKGISKADIAEDGKYQCIRYGQLYTDYNEVIDEVNSTTNLSKEELVFSSENDVVIPASGESQIDIATASCVLRPNVALGGDLNIIRSNINGIFLAYYLNNKRKYDIARLSQGISVVHLYPSQLKTLDIFLPSSSEQQKIASFLSSVDKKIQQLAKKVELLKEYKKGVMQKIFSHETDVGGSRTPLKNKKQGEQIRFKDENGDDFPDWEKKRLGEICDKISSGKSKKEIGGKYNLFGSTGIIGQCSSATHNGKYLLIARVGANAGLINIVNGSFGVSDNTLVIGASGNIIFIYYLLIKYNLNRLIFGSGQPLITGGQLKSLRIKLPANQEQHKIANFLSSIDKKILAISTQLEQTQKFKKGLLQQMFV